MQRCRLGGTVKSGRLARATGSSTAWVSTGRQIVPSGLVIRTGSQFKRLSAESLRRQVPRRPEARTAPLYELPRPVELRLELRESGLGELHVDALALELVPDRRVAVAPSGEALRPSAGEASVVHEACVGQRGQRLLRRGWVHCAFEALGEPSAGHVPMAQRPARFRERLGTPQLPPEQAQRGPVEGAAFGEPRSHDDVDRNSPPRRAVKLDRDTAAPIVAQRSDRRHYRSGTTSRPPSRPAL
jgi:hypothetical protein